MGEPVSSSSSRKGNRASCCDRPACPAAAITVQWDSNSSRNDLGYRAKRRNSTLRTAAAAGLPIVRRLLRAGFLSVDAATRRHSRKGRGRISQVIRYRPLFPYFTPFAEAEGRLCEKPQGQRESLDAPSEPPNARHVVWRLAAELRLTSLNQAALTRRFHHRVFRAAGKEGCRLFLFAQSRCPCGAARHALFRSAFSARAMELPSESC